MPIVRSVVPVLLAASLVLVPTGAHAADTPPVGEPRVLLNVATGSAVDVANGNMAENQKIQEWPYHDVRGQQWWLMSTGSHVWIKSNVNGAYCLARESATGENVVLRSCENPLAEWDFENLGDELWRIVQPGTNRSLATANSTPTQDRQLVVSAAGGDTARWYFSPTSVRKRPRPADPRLDQVSFLTAHNAFANSDEGFWGRVPNQSYSLRSQLEQGVRGFQLDAYATGGTVKMCHNFCLWGERTLAQGLQSIVDYLNKDRNAIVTVFLEDYTTVEQLHGQVDAVPGIQSLLLYPDRLGVRENGWPTVSRLIAHNNRLLLLSQRPGRDSFGFFHDRDWTVENYWSMGGSGANVACATRWPEVPLTRTEPGFVRLHVMNHYRDIPAEANAAADNGAKLAGRLERICGVAAGRKPNYLAVDFFQKPEGTAPAALVGALNTYW